MTSILTEIIGILVGGLSAMGTGLATGINATVAGLFIDATGSTPVLTQFGGLVAVFAGISLAVGITRKLFNWLITLGGRK